MAFSLPSVMVRQSDAADAFDDVFLRCSPFSARHDLYLRLPVHPPSNSFNRTKGKGKGGRRFGVSGKEPVSASASASGGVAAVPESLADEEDAVLDLPKGLYLAHRIPRLLTKALNARASAVVVWAHDHSESWALDEK